MSEAMQIVRSHPWEIAGLGVAPFRFVAMDEGKDGCHFCGTGIRYRFHCVSSDGKRFHVGCDCIARCHLPAETIVIQAERALKDHKRAKRREGVAAKRKAETEARRAKWEAERQANIARLATDPLYLRLEAHRGRDFLDKMRDAMERYGSLTEAQEAAAVKVMDRIEAEPARKAASYHLGQIGERVKLSATVEFNRCIYQGAGYYDPSRYLTKLRTDDGAVVVWFGAYALKEGAHVEGTATVKALDSYQGERQTTIKNPRWK